MQLDLLDKQSFDTNSTPYWWAFVWFISLWGGAAYFVTHKLCSVVGW